MCIRMLGCVLSRACVCSRGPWCRVPLLTLTAERYVVSLSASANANAESNRKVEKFCLSLTGSRKCPVSFCFIQYCSPSFFFDWRILYFTECLIFPPFLQIQCMSLCNLSFLSVSVFGFQSVLRWPALVSFLTLFLLSVFEPSSSIVFTKRYLKVLLFLCRV